MDDTTLNEYTDYMHGFIEEICEDIGPREAGSRQELEAGTRIEEELGKYCDETRQESFKSAPTAFLGFIRYGAALLAIAIGLYWYSLGIDLGWLSWNPALSPLFTGVATLIAIIAAIYFIFEVMRYHEIVDFLFPKQTSNNIMGIIEPTEEPKKTIIFSGHHDSAYEFNLFYKLKTFGAVTIFIGYLGIILFLVGTLYKSFYHFTGLGSLDTFLWLGYVYAMIFPVTLLYIFFHSYKSVPGAFDNLSAVSVALGVGKYLADHPEKKPKHTRVMLVSFAAEEAGVRGSKRFVDRHRAILAKKDTTVINMDGLAEKDNVLIVRNEPLIGATHDRHVNNELTFTAHLNDIPVKTASLPFGATDAAPFSVRGFPATSIFAYKNDGTLPAYYHSRLDTPAVVSKEALGQVLRLCLGYLERTDAEE